MQHFKLSTYRDVSWISVLKIVKSEEQWLINVDEDPRMRNTTFNNGRSGKQTFIGVRSFLVFLDERKVKNTFNCNYHKVKNCFKLVPVSDFGESLASVLHLIQQMLESPSMILEGA